jgi:hypothetical protein
VSLKTLVRFSFLTLLDSAMESHLHVAHAKRQALTVSMMAHKKFIAREFPSVVLLA